MQMSWYGAKGGEGSHMPTNTTLSNECVLVRKRKGDFALRPRPGGVQSLTKQIHSDNQKHRLFCVFRFAPFYTKQASLLAAGDLRRYV